MQIDVASILAIGLLIALCVVGWKSRRGNPGAFRGIVQEHAKLKNRMSLLEQKLTGCATKGDIAAISGKLDALEERSATAGDFLALQGQVHVVEERVASIKDITLDTRESVKVIERMLMKGALDK